MAKFMPNEIHCLFPHSVLKSPQKEAWVALIATFLAVNGNRWEEVEMDEIFCFALSEEAAERMHGAYFGSFQLMKSQQAYASEMVCALFEMVKEDYLTRRDAFGIHFTVTEKLLRFYGYYLR